MMMRNRDVITLGWITGYNDEQSANVNESKTKNPKQFIHHWGMQHNKNNTSSPPHACQDIPNITADSLLLNCALRLCRKEVFFFSVNYWKKRALNIKFPRSLWCQDGERLVLHSLSQWSEALTYLSSKTGRTQAGKVLPTGKVSEGWDSQLYKQTIPTTRVFQVNLTLETEPKVSDY